MYSMTGFGKAELSTKLGAFTVEISSVNNRYLEISVRMPRQFSSLENKLRELVKAHVSRGKVHVYLNYEVPADAPGRYPINAEAVKAYYKQLKEIQSSLKLSGDIRLQDILSLPEVSAPPQTKISDDVIWTPIKKTVAQALKALVQMRQIEGKAICADLMARTIHLAELNKDVVANSDGVTEKYREKLQKKVEELLGAPAPDQVRLETEVAILAERTDISEECTRLGSHVAQFRQNLRKKGPTGKKLNFILQEMNREANTVASKCNEITVSRLAIALKEEIENLREQIQNIE